MDSLPSLETSYKFVIAFEVMQNDVVRAYSLPWTSHLAHQFNIPRIVFHGSSCTSFLAWHHKTSSAEAEGVVVNSFEELEVESVKEYSEVKGGRVWCIGPVSLCNVETSDMAGRGHISAVNVHHCTKWLDLHEPGCVIYVALGSLARPAPEQMMELPLALDESNRPFVWGLGGASSPALEGMFVESGFVRRTRDRGFLIHGWAPQLVILSHPAVGGFLTHCGWNSKVEGITAGCLGVAFGEEEKAEVFVAKDAIKGALVVLMEEGAEMRVGELSLHKFLFRTHFAY
ncbi:hypothetical protein SASPL_108585 [Salvia splendens]|uniref:Uncharacterized protein n=1 Tax=Salvia splendens TaxID=180675 RepID=A0A8X8YCJ0_SALSN|nr:hypothetical protein SASPL_108585 [Salvia splendens]